MATMNNQQVFRYNKIQHERFYLLNIKNQEDKYIINVSGSTRNIYNIEVSKEEKKISCNCPDMKNRAPTLDCVCKHCCFVIFKVCRDTIATESDFFSNLVFNDEDFGKLTDKLEEKYQIFNQHRFLEEPDDSVDLSLIEIFHTLSITEEDGSIFETKLNKIQIEDPCAICCEDICDEPDNVECPECHKVFHKQCQDMWLATGNISCSVCRSTSWTNYQIEPSVFGEYQNLGY
jgi:hypothetical protein